MKLFPRKTKIERTPAHAYFGEFGETPLAISRVDATTDAELGSESPHLSRSGHKFFVVIDGAIEVEVNGQSVRVDPAQTLMVEPTEIHRVVRLIEAPCTFLVLGTVKDPTGTDKVVL